MRQETCDDVYRDRILRTTYGAGEYYSWKTLGATAANLAAVTCFFEEPWKSLPASLSSKAQTWLLAEAANYLCGLGRVIEALVPVTISVDRAIYAGDWWKCRHLQWQLE